MESSLIFFPLSESSLLETIGGSLHSFWKNFFLLDKGTSLGVTVVLPGQKGGKRLGWGV